jgi:cytochrome P450
MPELKLQLHLNDIIVRRLPELFGEDADEFNIDRWMRNKEVPERGVGIFANLITFAHGPKACIGMNLRLSLVLVCLTNERI